MSKNKGKKEKITYVDDGSTIVDMSATKNPTKSVKKETTQNNNQYYSPVGNTFKDKARTYFKAVKQMLIPMFVTMLFLCVAFLILYFLF